jgi:hypothetical protein
MNTAIFQGYSPEADGYSTNPDGTPLYDGQPYYRLPSGKMADAYYCREHGFALADSLPLSYYESAHQFDQGGNYAEN